MDPKIFAQFGAHAPAVQALFEGIYQTFQQRINQLEQQVNQQPAPAANISPQDLTAAIAAAVASIPRTQANPREPKVAEPPIFNGDKKEVQSFLRAVQLHFELLPTRFPQGDEIRRILFALTFIRGGTAGTWANNHTTSMLDADPAKHSFKTFEEFRETFEQAFGDADRKQKARIDMAALKMKPGDTVEEYTTTFEALASHTDYNEAGHIQAYRSGLHPRILEKIYGDSNGELPADLKAWKTKARRLDNLYHEFKALRTVNSSNTVQSRAQAPRAPPTTTSVAPKPTTAPDAMDVDAHRGKRAVECYNCNKLGHMSYQCPEPRKDRSLRATVERVVRSILTEDKKPQGQDVEKAAPDFQDGQE